MDQGEIQLEVGKHLRTPDLLTCVLVSKEWNSIFIPQLYRNIELVHSPQWAFPRRGTLSELATSLYRFRIHIRSLHLELVAFQIDQLLSTIESSSQSKDKTILEPLTTGTQAVLPEILPTPLFLDLASLTLNVVYDSQGAGLAWIAHCPHLQSLHLVVPTLGRLKRAASQDGVDPLPTILALPFWSTTLRRLQISGGTLAEELETQILKQCTALRELVLCPQQQTGVGAFETFAGFFQSLSHLDMTERKVPSWVLQPILGSFTSLQKLFLSKFSVYGVLGVVPWPGEPEGVFPTEWACTRLKFLHIDSLMWCSSSDTNTSFLAQLARLKELESLEIMMMGCDDRSIAVLHHFPIETPWNLDPCEVPLPWMKEMWPKLTGYKSGGWIKRDVEIKKWGPEYNRVRELQFQYLLPVRAPSINRGHPRNQTKNIYPLQKRF